MAPEETERQGREEPPSPLVTVLIVSFNCAEALRRCLAAIENSQGRDRIEILVVDNGSQDGSAHVDEEFPNITVLRLPRNFGGSKARNVGMRTAKGEHILFLSPQVDVQPDTILTLIERLEGTPQAGAVAPLLVGPDGKAAPQVRGLPDTTALMLAAQGNWEASPVTTVEAVSEVDYVEWKALLVKKTTIAGMNFFDERFGEHWADLDLCYKLRRAGRKILIYNDLSAVDHGEPHEWQPSDFAQSVLNADRSVGAARFADKHFGTGAGLGIRARLCLKALFSLRLSYLSSVLAGQIVDGTDTIS